MNKKAVVLLSGGIDSTTCMGIASSSGFECYPISFFYNQRHHIEVEHARKVADYFGVGDRHKIVDVSYLGNLGASSLTDENMAVRTSGLADDDIPETYVPARNLIFLSLATAYAEVIGAKTIFIGVSAVDYSGYPDCRPEFIQSFTQTINLATKMGVTSQDQIKVETPLIHLSKKDTIALGLSLQVPYHLTTSCYLGGDNACGVCDSCVLRLKGFRENEIAGPIGYR